MKNRASIFSARKCVNLCFAVLIFSAPLSAQTISQIVAFGDSWTDPVNSDPDGPSYAYLLADLLNVPIDNNAVGGATSGAINQQISNYLSSGVDPDALHIYWAVGNDFLEPGGQDDTSATNVLMANNAADGLDMLLQAGAQHFLVFNSIDNALRPITIAMDGQAEATAVSIEYNQLMRDVLIARGLNNSLFDSFSFFTDLVLDGRFTNIDQGCSSIACNNPGEFVWWDNIHPSAESHTILASGAFFKATAPPGSSPPIINSTAIIAATVGTLYRYDVQANDPDLGSVITFQLINAPTGMTIATNTGVISWTPTTANIGANTIAVKAADDTGLTDTQGFTINVTQQTSGGNPPRSGGGGSISWLLVLATIYLVTRNSTRKNHVQTLF